MSLAQMIDKEALYLDGVITLKYFYPRCSVCHRLRPQSDRKFMDVHGGTCPACISRREGEAD